MNLIDSSSKSPCRRMNYYKDRLFILTHIYLSIGQNKVSSPSVRPRTTHSLHWPLRFLPQSLSFPPPRNVTKAIGAGGEGKSELLCCFRVRPNAAAIALTKERFRSVRPRPSDDAAVDGLLLSSSADLLAGTVCIFVVDTTHCRHNGRTQRRRGCLI